MTETEREERFFALIKENAEANRAIAKAIEESTKAIIYVYRSEMKKHERHDYEGTSDLSGEFRPF